MNRFASISAEEVEDILSNKDAKNTSKGTDFAWAILMAYLRSKQIEVNFETVSITHLDEILGRLG